MNSDPFKLMNPRLKEAVKGAVVVIDTAIRFFDGDENSSQDMKVFGSQCQELIHGGVRSVILLHHNSKGAEGLTLEGGRGSGDFGGFSTCCWGTTLDDYEDVYKSQSVLACVKQRDFQADSFKVAPTESDDDFFLRYVGGSENAKVVTRQFKGNKDGQQETAEALIEANLDKTAEGLVALLAEHGIKRGDEWCRRRKLRLCVKGATLTATA